MTKLLLLGTSGYHPSEFRHTSCMMLPECGIVLDAGTAMFRVREWLTTDELDIFLSHTHLDHVIGLTFLFDILHEKHVKHVRVHGQPAKLKALQQHLFATDLFPAQPPIEWRPLTGGVDLTGGADRLGKATLTSFPLEHPGDSIGFRLDWPAKSMAYVTDTTARLDAEYVDRIRGVDLLIHECHFPDGMEEKAAITGHSCTSSVANVAREAEVGQLVLVHINPMAPATDPVGLDRATAIFPNTQIGIDQMEIDF